MTGSALMVNGSSHTVESPRINRDKKKAIRAPSQASFFSYIDEQLQNQNEERHKSFFTIEKQKR